MLRNALHLIVFLLGLAAAVWIGVGYIGHNTLGAAVALLIAACYCVGGWELLQFRRATDALRGATGNASEREDLDDWLKRVPSALRGAVRLRVEGNRSALPGPALTPYLVGLLVLLGMLGTLLGMMATLRGTGMALQSATDLQAIRGSLASPVEGLAVAFGTSIAGVAASAMLGLLSALLRRERLAAVQLLDQHIRTDLSVHGHAWQRAEGLRLMQGQAAVLPTLVQQLQQMVDGVQQAAAASHAQLEARQEAFIARHDAAQELLAARLEQSLQRGVQAGTEAIGTTLQPLLRDALGNLEATAARTQSSVTDAVQRQLDALQASTQTVSSDLRAQFEGALSAQQAANAALVTALGSALSGVIASQQDGTDRLLGEIDGRLRSQVEQLGAHWATLAEQQQAAGNAATERDALARAAALEAQQADARALLAQLQDTHQALLERTEQGDQARLQQWSQAFTVLAEQAGAQWVTHSERATAQQQHISETLQQTASSIGEEARRQSTATLAEITRLLDAASEAPRAAAEVVAELRQRLSESLVRDTALLDERAQLLGTVGSLMESIQATSSAQRVAVDQLIENAAGLMQRTGERFAEQVDAQAGTLQQLVGSVADAATGSRELAAGLEGAVTAFTATSSGLSTHLEHLSGALDASLARSDEQLAYYVAQAREVVDLSLLSQKQITEELRQLGKGRAPAGTA
ncbi:hypothetical protein [Stenotrophomonas sp. SORGH_AS_0321]|uniref:hypothetical protein n=1 Tax=Stenotrophomonas sp. SORGH_AS_0321 TaxID=3041787 RepID=UPI00285E3815|nr:hypothetical protein [Stenotrophomonas sp. SORGH_AS_0321]MDR6094404.1 hypothetical protein [Stenotrophomonas sp. SORGH_AS_0321]